ncbi:MAG: DsbA family oxidoreductase [Betaproteobacteria bacterium]
MSGEFQIDVISDVVCPWCYVGQRRLAAALAQLPADDPARRATLRWHPFQLNPDMPPAGISRKTYAETKFGSPKRVAELNARLVAVGETLGIPFAFDHIVHQPNTLDAHRLINWAQAQRDASDIVERLFQAFFVDGRNIGDHTVLADIAGESGFSADAARAMLDSGEGADAIASMDERARAIGVQGVPFFIFNQRIAVSGAQEPATLLDAIAQAKA